MPSKILLLLLPLISFYGLQERPLRNSIAQPGSRKVVAVDLCTLLSKPADYDDKEVRVRATYHIGFEHSYLDDSSCKEYAVETTPYWTGNVVWAAFDRPSIEASTEPNTYDEFKRVAKPCCPPDWRDTEVELTVVGRFFKADGEVGYGHSKIYALQLVIDKIEAVNIKKAVVPSPKENR